MPERETAQHDTSDPETPAEPERFNQARAAQALALLEDYVEMVGDLIDEFGEARITDLAQRMGVTHPTATKAVTRLKREGLAISRPYRGVFLTEAGTELADRVRARHRTVVDFLIAVGVPAETAELDAEGMEHHVSDATLHAFEQFLLHELGRRRAMMRRHPGLAPETTARRAIAPIYRARMLRIRVTPGLEVLEKNANAGLTRANKGSQISWQM